LALLTKKQKKYGRNVKAFFPKVGVTGRLMKKITEERFGLMMIVAALVVIVLIAGQFLIHRQTTRDKAIRIEGRNIVHLLTNLSFEQLVPAQRQNSILDLLNSRQIDSDFAYAAVVDSSGQPIAASSSGAAMIPPVDLKNEKTLWATEHEFEIMPEQRTVLEFRVPVLRQGELAGYIRVGYFKPELTLQELPFIAQLALTIFLLVPFTYFLLRRELKPIEGASKAINQIMQRQHIARAEGSSDNFQDFMQNFKLFVNEIDRRFSELNNQNLKTKATTLALNYSRQRIESALESLPDAILVMDETGKATFANAKLKTALGPSASIIGAKPHEWCEDKKVNELLAKYYSSQSRLHRMESVEFKPSHNSEKTFTVSAYPLFTPKDTDTMLGTLVVFHDKTQEILAKSARDQFISSVAHELKSPLNVIHMSAETLLHEHDLSADERIQSINIINDEIERLSSLITNLLNITMMEAGSMVLDSQRVKVFDFLQDILNSVERAKNTQFDTQLSNNLSTIEADKNLLRIALNNLLTNAIKYNKPGGKVTLSADETDGQLIIHISDTGIGISDDDQEHIFEKFYRSENDDVRQKPGHGLGLALAKEIIELHGGKLSLQSTVGEGSTFTVILKKTSTLLKGR
jgi:signal transduction histidine kinase